MASPGFEPRILELTDGTKVHVRPIVPEDEALLHDAVAAMSERSVYFRFFSPLKRMPDALAHRLAVVDYYDRIPNTDMAETAVAVVDEFQRRGLGSALMTILGKVARDHGIKTFTLIV